jgi:hypothetical protein
MVVMEESIRQWQNSMKIMPPVSPMKWQIKNYWVLIISKITGHAEKYAEVKQCFIFPQRLFFEQFFLSTNIFRIMIQVVRRCTFRFSCKYPSSFPALNWNFEACIYFCNAASLLNFVKKKIVQSCYLLANGANSPTFVGSMSKMYDYLEFLWDVWWGLSILRI